MWWNSKLWKIKFKSEATVIGLFDFGVTVTFWHNIKTFTFVLFSLFEDNVPILTFYDLFAQLLLILTGICKILKSKQLIEKKTT